MEEKISIKLYTDSKSLVGALHSKKINNQMIYNLLNHVKDLNKHHSIEIKWIKGHANFTGNEAADCLANLGRRVEQVETGDEQVVVELPMPRGTVKTQIRRQHEKIIDKRWKDAITMRQSKLMLNDIKRKTKLWLIKKSRTQLRTIVAIATGHCNLNYHLTLLGFFNHDQCRACEEDLETPYHIAYECPVHDNLRRTNIDPERDILSNAIALIKLSNRYSDIMYYQDPP